MPKAVTIAGLDVYAALCALTLADLGFDVNLVTPRTSLVSVDDGKSGEQMHQQQHLWPLLLRIGAHPRIKILTNATIVDLSGKKGKIKIKGQIRPRYVNQALCTGCGECESACSVKVRVLADGKKVSMSAIHSPALGQKSAPSAYVIEKEGISPCRASCPLGINVQGFVALLGKGKIEKALALINESAPMASVLGRLCTHPCESNCSRQKVDSPVFVQALHRYCADHAQGETRYRQKAPPHSKKDKVAIVGSGPAGLAAAWELARRGYTPTVFESHAVVGGMLATGIPRFRLPREIREKEVERIRAMGVDFKTGVSVGRDVTYSDLLERGYQAFFLAIGAQQNNRLNVPGEHLKGVLDAISLLFALNIHVEDTVGSDVIVVGGGNSAVDSARSARRISKGQVRILCLTDQMTAVKEDVDEALREGVIIDYGVNVKQILGRDNNVAGVRCERVKNVTFEPDGRIKMESLPGSEFELPADRVVVAIGQRPATAALNIEGLKTRRNGSLEVDPVTLETSVKGVFGGGDAVTGSNNVVESMAGGIRAAESIDRFLSGKDLHKGRSADKIVPVEPDILARQVVSHKRAAMPNLPLAKRRHSYEETNLGLAATSVQSETERCINCAICCECLECEEACKLKAVSHGELARPFELDSAAVVNFGPEQWEVGDHISASAYQFLRPEDGRVMTGLAQAASLGLKVALDLDFRELEKNQEQPGQTRPSGIRHPIALDSKSIFLCKCGDSISSLLDFGSMSEALEDIPGVVAVHRIPQACTPEGAREIKLQVEKDSSGKVVLAACRCCNQDQICFSCTDRRVACQNNLKVELHSAPVEYVNIREQCAWLYRDDSAAATSAALEKIAAALNKTQGLTGPQGADCTIEPRVLVIAAGAAGIAAAESLAAAGYESKLMMLPVQRTGEHHPSESHSQKDIAKTRLKDLGVSLFEWPVRLLVGGRPGQYQVRLQGPDGEQTLSCGSIILDLGRLDQNLYQVLSGSDLLARILSRQNLEGPVPVLDSTLAHGFTLGETAGLFLVVSFPGQSRPEAVAMGEAAASRACAYLRRGKVEERKAAVIIQQKFCRGCGDCARQCSYIALKPSSAGFSVAEIDPALCFGCGACVSVCPTGAISQPSQSEAGLKSQLEALLEGSAT